MTDYIWGRNFQICVHEDWNHRLVLYSKSISYIVCPYLARKKYETDSLRKTEKIYGKNSSTCQFLNLNSKISTELQNLQLSLFGWWRHQKKNQMATPYMSTEVVDKAHSSEHRNNKFRSLNFFVMRSCVITYNFSNSHFKMHRNILLLATNCVIWYIYLVFNGISSVNTGANKSFRNNWKLESHF